MKTILDRDKYHNQIVFYEYSMDFSLSIKEWVTEW